jgi:hypothetical protein
VRGAWTRAWRDFVEELGRKMWDDACDIELSVEFSSSKEKSMSLVHASQRVINRGTCLRSSYLEISRFFRARSHGITPGGTATCSQHGVRYFSGSRSLKELIEPDEKLRKTLEEFKATSMSFLPILIPMLTSCSQTNSLERHRKFL